MSTQLEIVAERLEHLKHNPTDVKLATEAWLALSSPRDLRSSMEALRIFSASAVASADGRQALSAALHALFKDSGEVPSRQYFDAPVVRAILQDPSTGDSIAWLQRLLRSA